MTAAQTVTADLVVDLVVAGGPPLPVTARLAFSQDDPFALTLSFLVESDQWVTWTFARALLAEGISSAAGEGDVQVWPGVREAERCTFLHTRSPHGAATFVLPLNTVVEFLFRTFALVPSGTESELLDIDSEIAVLRAG